MLQVKLNTDEAPKVASEYGIRSIPTVMIFKDGKKLDTVIGAVPKVRRILKRIFRGGHTEVGLLKVTATCVTFEGEPR